MTIRTKQNMFSFSGNISTDPKFNEGDDPESNALYFRLMQNQVRYDKDTETYVSYYLNGEGEQVELKPFSFFVKVRGAAAEHYANILAKGMHVHVEGELEHSTERLGDMSYPSYAINATLVNPTARFLLSVERMPKKNTGESDHANAA